MREREKRVDLMGFVARDYRITRRGLEKNRSTVKLKIESSFLSLMILNNADQQAKATLCFDNIPSSSNGSEEKHRWRFFLFAKTNTNKTNYTMNVSVVHLDFLHRQVDALLRQQ